MVATPDASIFSRLIRALEARQTAAKSNGQASAHRDGTRVDESHSIDPNGQRLKEDCR